MHESKGCIIMASGSATRFGSNKLLQNLGGRTVIEHVIDTVKEFSETSGTRPVVITRYREVADMADRRDIAYLLHSYESKSDVIKLGIRYAVSEGWSSCMFVLGDQPLLTAGSILRLAEEHALSAEQNKVFRLGYEGTAGSPVIFSKCHYETLMSLTGEQGGMSVFGPADTTLVSAGRAEEMIDIDFPEDLQLIRIIYEEH